MITAAHIGVGISGLEGQQAARASDYAIGQFKFLRNLLFVHGRESYRKNSYVVWYMFYKDVLFVMCIFWYGTVSAFSGLTIFEQWLYQFYNILFSCFPIMWFAVFDYELPKAILSRDPKYYIYTVNPTLTNYKFGRWIFYGLWQSVVLCILAFIPFESQGGSFWMEGNFVYLGVVLIVNIKILWDIVTPSFSIERDVHSRNQVWGSITCNSHILHMSTDCRIIINSKSKAYYNKVFLRPWLYPLKCLVRKRIMKHRIYMR